MKTQNEAFSEATNYILPMLDFLPKEYTVPLKLADIDNMKQAVIAKELNLSLPTIKSRIQRARQLLKAELITCCNFETYTQHRYCLLPRYHSKAAPEIMEIWTGNHSKIVANFQLRENKCILK